MVIVYLKILESIFDLLKDKSPDWLLLNNISTITIACISAIIAFFSFRNSSKANSIANEANSIANEANSHASKSNIIAEKAHNLSEEINRRQTESNRSSLQLRITKEVISGSTKYYFSIINDSDFKVYEFKANINLHVYYSNELDSDTERRDLWNNKITIESLDKSHYIDINTPLLKAMPSGISQLLNPQSTDIPGKDLTNTKFSILSSKIQCKSELGNLYEFKSKATDLNFYALAEGDFYFDFELNGLFY